MKATEVMDYLRWADDFALVCRKDDRLVTLSDVGEQGMYHMLILAADCLMQDSDEDFDELLEAMHEADEATIH
jgi:uncharacterized protein YcsI (UPF0317 family)